MITNNKTNNEYSLLNYSKHELNNFKNGKIKVAKHQKDILEFVKISKKMPSNSKLFLGKIGAKLADRIYDELKLYLCNYNISLKTDSIRHIFNHHSNSREILRGQVPIETKDFNYITKIITEFDQIKISGVTDKNKSVIVYEKIIKNKYYLICYL